MRLRLLNLLAAGEVCVCHLHGALDLPQSEVSRIWRISENEDWWLAARKGLWVHYRWLTRRAISIASDAIALWRVRRKSKLTQDRQRLEHRGCCDEKADFWQKYIRLSGSKLKRNAQWKVPRSRTQ